MHDGLHGVEQQTRCFMGQDQTELMHLIDNLALQSMVVEADDLMGLGDILNQLEQIEKIIGEKEHSSLRTLAQAVRKIVEKIILNECPDLQESINLMRTGVKLIQHRITFPETPISSEEEGFWKRWSSITGEKGLLDKAPESQQGTNQNTPSCRFTDQDIDLYKDFISEALEHLGSIELNLINLEQFPDHKEYINSIFRPFHTIKGVSGFLNLHDIQTFSHAMESLLDEARNGKLHITREIIDFILESVDLLKQMILELRGHIESGRTEYAARDLEPHLKRIDVLKKSSMLHDQLGQERNERETDDEAVLPNPPRLGEILSSKGVVSPEEISKALQEQEAGGENLKLGEILIKEHKAKPKQILDALREQKQMVSQFREAFVKVDTEKLDNLVDLIGELVIAQSLVEQNPFFLSQRDQKLVRDFSQLKRITADLQKISMSLRMVPIRQTFQKMVRLVRDLGKKSGKSVELVMSGEETEIDRNMVDSLYDPLVHMIRNAMDHGIESGEERRRRGKSESGTIFLRAYQKGGNVVIEIEDDGQGLNRAKILKKARERGIISEMALTDYQIDQLIFEPGFSTADQITDISGRGVGMDVVKKAIETLRGKIEIFSHEGSGTRFVIRVPLTLAIMDGIVVRVGEERYIIPTVFIKETLQPRKEDIFSIHHKGELVKVRENFLPLVRLDQLLGVTSRKQNPWETLVIVAENEGTQKCLMVDDLLGKQEVVIKNLGEKLKDLKGVAGATILGDGKAGLILDIHSIFQMDPLSPLSFQKQPLRQNGGLRNLSVSL